jgi:hypothetical protein
VFGAPIPSAAHALESRDQLVAAQRSAVESALQRARALLPAITAPAG